MKVRFVPYQAACSRACSSSSGVVEVTSAGMSVVAASVCSRRSRSHPADSPTATSMTSASGCRMTMRVNTFGSNSLVVTA